MPVIHTHSATPLEAVTLEPGRAGTTHVWLRKNITKSTEEFEGQPCDVWTADEVYIHMDPAPTIEEVDARFDELWGQASAPDRPNDTPPVRIADLERALAELGDLLGEVL